MILKYSAFSLFFFWIALSGILNQALAQKSEVNWMSMSEALKQNNKNPRKIFIDVYTDWCGWCKKMDNTTFSDSEVASLLNDHFYPVKFDAESSQPIEFNGKVYKNPNPGGRRSAHELASALLKNKLSYPSYVILDSNNRGLTVLKGYLKKEQMMPVLRYIGKDIYEEMEWKEYKQKQNR